MIAKKDSIIDLLKGDKKPTGVVGSPSDSFEVTIEVFIPVIR